MALLEPIIIDRDPQKIINEMVADYEKRTNTKLQPAESIMLLIHTLAYREYLLRQSIQDAGKENLLAFATAPMLDYLGELLGVSRLAPSFATTKLKITLVENHVGMTIPSGLRVGSADGMTIFEIDESIVVNAGTKYVENIVAICQNPGKAGNNYIENSINVMLDPVSYIAEIKNTTKSGGGSEEESDDQLRERIRLAPAIFSNAGSKEAYKYWTKTASALIIDVAVTSDVPGVVNIYPLVEGGELSDELIERVSLILNADKVRPLTDTVNVLQPALINYMITAKVTLFSNAEEDSTKNAILTALDQFTSNREKQLGLDVLKKQIEAIIFGIAGVYNVDIIIDQLTYHLANAEVSAGQNQIEIIAEDAVGNTESLVEIRDDQIEVMEDNLDAVEEQAEIIVLKQAEIIMEEQTEAKEDRINIIVGNQVNIIEVDPLELAKCEGKVIIILNERRDG